MSILYGGSIFYKPDIVFEDNTFDLASAHPVFVLFTTDSYDENAYVLSMTSDKKRAECNKKIYTPVIYNKKSFLNLSRTIKIPNIIKEKYELIDISEYERLLKDFYEYQISKEDNNFTEIKDRIGIILKMLELSNDDETKEIFINNTHLQRYLINNKCITDNTLNQIIEAIEQRENGNKKLGNSKKLKDAALMEFDEFSTYMQNNSYLESDNLLNSTSEEYQKFRKYYNMLQTKYSMVNVYQLLLAEVAMSYRDDTSQSKILKLKNIEKFIEMEIKIKEKEIADKRKSNEEKEFSKKTKSEMKSNKKKEEIKKRKRLEAKKKRERLVKKYGEFVEF